MAQILDFPTNFEEKIRQADELLEKQYVDQAICLLEDFIEQTNPVKGLLALKKTLLTCYFIKKEFETCEMLLEELLIGNEDLSLWAHHLLLERSMKGEEAVFALQQEYENRLKDNRFVYKNLIELTIQLKNFYEKYWFEEASKKVNNFLSSSNFEQQVLTLSDLQHLSKDDLECFKEELCDAFERRLNPIIKTLLFELLAQKGVEWDLTFFDQDKQLTLRTTLDQLSKLYEVLEQVNALIEQQGVPELMKELLNQQVILFYQFCFPFYESIEMSKVIEGLLTVLGEINMSFSDEDDYNLTNNSIINYTSCKLSQYLLSLSSLM